MRTLPSKRPWLLGRPFWRGMDMRPGVDRAWVEFSPFALESSR